MAVSESTPYSIQVSGWPLLTNAKHSGIGVDGADLWVTTDQAVGTLYWIADLSSQVPSAAQVAAGLNGAGSSAMSKGSASVLNIGTLGPYRPSGFQYGATVHYWFVQLAADGINYSNVTGGQFRTALDPGLPDSVDPAQRDHLVSFYN